MIILAIIIIVFILFFIIKSTENNDDIIDQPIIDKGKAGENAVSQILRSLPEEYLVIDNVIIPDQVTDPNKKYTTQIDHVVVSPFGIFVIETKNYSGWIFGNEKSKKWKQTFRTTEAQYLYNPIKQNWGHIYALAENLHLNSGVFKPIIVFSDDCELHISSTTPVVYMSELKECILQYTQEIIPRGDVTAIFDRLNEINLTGEEIEEQHINSIKERFIDKETTIQNGVCPHCGGKLVIHDGKYGPFYGCSNYPRCKFTYEEIEHEEIELDEDESENEEQLNDSAGEVEGYPKKRFPFLLFGLAIFIVIAILLATNSGSDDAKNSRSVGKSTSTQLEIAESKEYHDLSIAITDMRFARHNGNLKYEKMVDSEKINCCVYATVENQGEKTINLTDFDVKLVCDGKEYEQFLIDNKEFLFYHQTVGPKESLRSKVIDFQIPSDQQNSDSQIYITIISPDGQKTVWNLR